METVFESSLRLAAQFLCLDTCENLPVLEKPIPILRLLANKLIHQPDKLVGVWKPNMGPSNLH